MYIAKVDRMHVKILDARTGVERRIILAGKGIQSAVVQGDVVVVNCGDGKVRIYDANTGLHLRTL